jgi:hypothetical protein
MNDDVMMLRQAGARKRAAATPRSQKARRSRIASRQRDTELGQYELCPQHRSMQAMPHHRNAPHGMQDLLSSRPATQQTFVHARLNEMDCLVAALMAGSCAARRH